MRIVGTLLFCLTVILSSGSVSFGEGEAAPSHRFTVGVSAPFTGDLAQYGVAVRNGIDLALSMSPTYKERFNFVFEDNQYDPALSVSTLRKLRDLDHVDVVYHWGEAPLSAVAPIAEREHIPLVAMSVDARPAVGAHYIIRTINPPEDFAGVLMTVLRKRGYKRIGLIVTDDPFLGAMAEGLKKSVNGDEKLEVIATVSPTESEFRSIIVGMKHRKFDAIGIYLLPGQISNFYRQASTLHLSLPSFGTDIFENDAEVRDANGAMEGTVYPLTAVPQDFTERYMSKFGNNIEIAYAYNAYLFTKVTLEKFAKATTKLTPEAVLTEYQQPSNDASVLFMDVPAVGRYWKFQMVVKRVEKDRFSVVEE